MADATDAERLESDVDTTSSGVWLAFDDRGVPGAVRAWSVWPHDVAHVCVLTARAHWGGGAGLRRCCRSGGPAPTT